MAEQMKFTVPEMTCGHCVSAVTEEVQAVSGVQSVHVDLDTKAVVVDGTGVQWDALVAAVDEAGYELVR